MSAADPLRPRRSALYLPASNTRAIEKARGLACDVVILDLEDAVGPDEKPQARAQAVAAAQAGGFGGRELVIRVNALDTPWGRDDLAAVAGAGVQGVLVPKVSGPQDLAAYAEALGGGARLWAMIETCAAVGGLFELAALGVGSRLSLWIMGTNDLAKEMHARLTPDRAAFVPLLVQAVCAARAHGLAIMDGVCNEFRDLAVFRAEAEQGLALGFDGKSLIHPDQIGPCNEIYSPGDEELAHARAIIAAFALPENAGKGAIRVEGKMAELLHLDQARRLVAIADRIAAG